MTKTTLDILFKTQLSTLPSSSIPVYDIKIDEETGESLSLLDEKWNLTAEKKAERYIITRLFNEGYTLFVAVNGCDDVGFIAEKDGKKSLLVFVLDSESEKRMWLADELKESYSVFIIRDRIVRECEGIEGVTLDEAFSSFNFLSR